MPRSPKATQGRLISQRNLIQRGISRRNSRKLNTVPTSETALVGNPTNVSSWALLQPIRYKTGIKTNTGSHRGVSRISQFSPALMVRINQSSGSIVLVRPLDFNVSQ